MSKLNILIVGASIAGPTAAYWFAKAGANVTVIERFPQLRTAGQQIDIRSVGVSVMRKMDGMEEAVRRNLAPMEGMQLVRGDGRPIATMNKTGDAEQQSLVSEFEIFRGDLSRIMYDMTKDQVMYVFNEQVTAMHHSADGPITVDFLNGHPTTVYDLVVACDGATSRTRAIGFDCAVRDHVVSNHYWAAFFSIKDDLLKGSLMGQAYTTIGGRFLAIGPDPTGINRVTLQSMHPPTKTEKDTTRPFREASKAGITALKTHVAERFAGSGWQWEQIEKGMMATEDFYASESVQVHMPSLSKGHFVLVGDAGYAGGPTGMGTSLAMAGAYLLAGEIATHKTNLSAGLQAYEDRMRPILKDLQKPPPGVTTAMAPQTAWGICVRNWILWGVTCVMAMGPAFSWIGALFGTAFAGAEKYDIPDYEWEVSSSS
ncbi:Hypothetical protein R9X50_00000600 [Acrodontium crateriforme]|uniref:FAD-binding domain-containing protein n=1 Tax=Acrodontium crateriforme TaxID=150365 RepID=A0AAQ3LWP3_9PEZI|nr:Hypothetical protein R9X50_00000600 [Acrodontium crateriforme]